MKNRFKFILPTVAAVALALSSTTVLADTNSDSQSQSQSSQTTVTENNQNNQNNQNSNSAANSNSSQKQETENKSNSTSSTTKKPTTKPAKAKTSKKWQTINGKKYYLVNGKRTIGYKKIGKSWYLFDKTGAALTGVRKMPHKSSYGYFNAAGQRRFKNTKTKRAYYWINKAGSITGIKNYAKVICQRPNMPTGCEITAVTMMLNFAGKNVTKEQAARVMPRSSDPNKGFIGSPYKEWPLGYWVAPNGVKSVVSHYLGRSQVMTGCSMTAIKKKLIRSHLVVVWVGMFDGISNHALALTGYHGNKIYYNDPWTGTKRVMSESTFRYHWKLDAHRALSY